MSSILEKDVEYARHTDRVEASGNSDSSLNKDNSGLRTLNTSGLESEDVVIELSEAEKKLVIRKVDWRVVMCYLGLMLSADAHFSP